MADEQQLIQEARQLIKEKQYDRARLHLQLVLRTDPDNATAQDWLNRLNQVDPDPQNFEDAREDLVDARRELVEAEEDIQEERQRSRRRLSLGTAALVFLGSLFGSMLGTIADAGEAIRNLQELQVLTYPDICVVGSDTILGEELGMAAAWEDAFEENNDVRIKLVATGSGRGVQMAAAQGTDEFNDLADEYAPAGSPDCNSVEVIAMSEPMTEEQQATLAENDVEIACAAEIGYDIVVFITDINNPIREVVSRDMTSVLRGRIDNWNRLSTRYAQPITILVRAGSGTTEVVLDRMALWDSEGGETFPEANYEVCDSNDDCLNRTLSTRGSLYWVSAAWMSTQPEQYLRVLSVSDGDTRSANPLEEDVVLSNYLPQLMRPLYMYVVKTDETSDEELQFAQDFLRYIRGVNGQQILEENFFYTHFDAPRSIVVPLPEGFDPVGTPSRSICN